MDRHDLPVKWNQDVEGVHIGKERIKTLNVSEEEITKAFNIRIRLHAHHSHNG